MTNTETMCEEIKLCCEEEGKHRDHCVWTWRGCLEKILHRTRWTEAMQRTNSSILEGRAGSGKADNDQQGKGRGPLLVKLRTSLPYRYPRKRTTASGMTAPYS